MDRRGERLNSAPFDVDAPEVRVNEIPEDTVEQLVVPPQAPAIPPEPELFFLHHQFFNQLY